MDNCVKKFDDICNLLKSISTVTIWPFICIRDICFEIKCIPNIVFKITYYKNISTLYLYTKDKKSIINKIYHLEFKFNKMELSSTWPNSHKLDLMLYREDNLVSVIGVEL